MQSKIDPYLRPLYDALFEMMGTENYAKLVEKQVKALSDKVDKHNNFDRRLVAIETKLDMKQEEKNRWQNIL